jgi:CubicO group peptidase (beta-lactamase class C family)
LTADRFSRRDFGRFAGLAGTAAALAGRPGTARAASQDAAVRADAAGPMLNSAGGRRLWRVNGAMLPGMQEFDATLMAFMEERDIPCGSLAVARDGRLLLARGYTWGARGVPETTPTSLFRVASVSKTVTAAAVLRLVQDGRLRLDARLTDLLPLAAPATGRAPSTALHAAPTALHAPPTMPHAASTALHAAPAVPHGDPTAVHGGTPAPHTTLAGPHAAPAGALAAGPGRPGTAPGDPRLSDVTVVRLLRHLGGWDRDVSGDPMFDDLAIAKEFGRPLPIGQDDIIRHVAARPLDHAPGTTFAYSNYGYLLLGRIIERVTGRPYAAYVRDALLAPLGITRMRLGRTLQPVPGEVPYFSQFTGTTVMNRSGARVAAPYGTFNQENNAFNCGWLATAVDLVRFARVYDGVTPVLTAASAAQAFAVPETGAKRGRYYGCGWHVHQGDRGLTTWHSGSLPGTHTLLVRRFDGLTWAVIFDQRDDPSGSPYREIDTALHETADDLPRWPAGDLSKTYF